jgi:type IV pilus assembly protein PilA
MASTLSSLRRRGSTTLLKQRLQLALLNRASRKGSLAEKGFTLVELMIVIAIVGILSAVAFPQFIGYRDRAELTSQIGEASGLAKECGTSIITGNPAPAATPATGIAVSGKCGGTASTGNDAALSYTTNAANASTAGVACGKDKLAASKNCVVSVDSSTGQVSYAPS